MTPFQLLLIAVFAALLGGTVVALARATIMRPAIVLAVSTILQITVITAAVIKIKKILIARKTRHQTTALLQS